MATAKLYNLARMTTATTGTGTITLGSAATGFLSFAGAGVQDAEVVTYAIEDGSDREIGRGTYTSSGTTLTRTVLKSTNSDNAIDLSGTAEVFICDSAEDHIAGPSTSVDSEIALFSGTGGATLKRASLTGIVKATSGVASAAVSGTDYAAASQTFDWNVFIETPANQDYDVVINCSHAGTITEITTDCLSGTCTLTGKVNTTALGGTANSVSTAEQSQAHASTNTFVAGDNIRLTVSSNSSCADMSVKIKYTRALA